MKNLKQKIIEFYKSKNEGPEDLFSCTEDIAYAIAEYAHKDQKRINGEPYFQHPYRVAGLFTKAITIPEEDKLVPRYVIRQFLEIGGGIYEVCLLHDVVEDTELTEKDIRDLYYELGFGIEYDTYISLPLQAITHDKKEDYDTYISKVLKNRCASLVKMLDMVDNINVFGLLCIRDEEYQRCLKYLKYIKQINDTHLFLGELADARNYYRQYLAIKKTIESK